MLETTVKAASYLFLFAILLLFSSAVPAVRKAFPKGFMLGFLLAVASLFIVLGGALIFR